MITSWLLVSISSNLSMVFLTALNWPFRVTASLVSTARRFWPNALFTRSSFPFPMLGRGTEPWPEPCSGLALAAGPSLRLGSRALQFLSHICLSSFHNHLFSSLVDKSSPTTTGPWHENPLSHLQAWRENSFQPCNLRPCLLSGLGFSLASIGHLPTHGCKPFSNFTSLLNIWHHP